MQIGRHLIMRYRDKPYLNAKPFEDYLRSVFMSYLIITCIVKDLRKPNAVSLMDNCSHDITPAVIELLSSAPVPVVVVTFALQPHTT
jgi:hypothetical protein